MFIPFILLLTSQPLSKGEGEKSFSFGEGFRMRIYYKAKA
jgi:hypothetical protein